MTDSKDQEAEDASVTSSELDEVQARPYETHLGLGFIELRVRLLHSVLVIGSLGVAMAIFLHSRTPLPILLPFFGLLALFAWSTRSAHANCSRIFLALLATGGLAILERPRRQP